MLNTPQNLKSEETPVAEPSASVILVNRALPYNCVGKLTGWSGVEYGQSVFEEAYGAHVCRMPLSQWRACKDDVARGSVRRACQWEVDIELPDSPATSQSIVDRVRDASASQIEAIVAGLGETVQAVVARVKHLAEAGQASALPASPAVTTGALKGDSSPSTSAKADAKAGEAAPSRPHTPESLAKIGNFRKLLNMAAQAGVEDPEQYHSTPVLRQAILARQALTA